MMKIGLLGGTFDPIHNGHLAIARHAIDKLELGKIIFIPSGIPPHKTNQRISPPEIRFEMVRLAIEEYTDYEISDIETKNTEVNYTINTIKYFLEKIEKKDLFFLIGADSLYELYTWKDVDELVRLCQFAVFVRKEYPIKTLESADIHLERSTFRECLRHIIKMCPVNVSATEIREKVALGEPITGLVPLSVEKYIYSHGLYKNRSSHR